MTKTIALISFSISQLLGTIAFGKGTALNPIDPRVSLNNCEVVEGSFPATLSTIQVAGKNKIYVNGQLFNGYSLDFMRYPPNLYYVQVYRNGFSSALLRCSRA